MEKYGGVNRGEEVETRVSASVVLTILKFVNDEIKKDFRSKPERVEKLKGDLRGCQKLPCFSTYGYFITEAYLVSIICLN